MSFLFVSSKSPLLCCAVERNGPCGAEQARRQARSPAGVSRQAPMAGLLLTTTAHVVAYGRFIPIAHCLELSSFKYLHSYSCQQDFGGNIRYKKLEAKG